MKVLRVIKKLILLKFITVRYEGNFTRNNLLFEQSEYMTPAFYNPNKTVDFLFNILWFIKSRQFS
jgi:hypothetical protein